MMDIYINRSENTADEYKMLNSSWYYYTWALEIKPFGQHYVRICHSDWCHQVNFTHNDGQMQYSLPFDNFHKILNQHNRYQKYITLLYKETQ